MRASGLLLSWPRGQAETEREGEGEGEGERRYAGAHGCMTGGISLIREVPPSVHSSKAGREVEALERVGIHARAFEIMLRPLKWILPLLWMHDALRTIGNRALQS